LKRSSAVLRTAQKLLLCQLFTPTLERSKRWFQSRIRYRYRASPLPFSTTEAADAGTADQSVKKVFAKLFSKSLKKLA
jgi:hypothetical protein